MRVVVGDAGPSVERHVEVDPHEHAGAGSLDVRRAPSMSLAPGSAHRAHPG